MKNLKKNSIILILITLTVLVFVLKDDFFDIMNSLKNANVLFMIAALLCFFVGILLVNFFEIYTNFFYICFLL